MPYILQTPCKHPDCECLATLNSEDGIIAFQTKELAEQYAKDFMADPVNGDTEVFVIFEDEESN